MHAEWQVHAQKLCEDRAECGCPMRVTGSLLRSLVGSSVAVSSLTVVPSPQSPHRVQTPRRAVAIADDTVVIRALPLDVFLSVDTVSISQRRLRNAGNNEASKLWVTNLRTSNVASISATAKCDARNIHIMSFVLISSSPHPPHIVTCCHGQETLQNTTTT